MCITEACRSKEHSNCQSSLLWEMWTERNSETYHFPLQKKKPAFNTHADGTVSSVRRAQAVGGLTSIEFQIGLTNNNRLDVAFSNVGQSLQHTEETHEAANLRQQIWGCIESKEMSCLVGWCFLCDDSCIKRHKKEEMDIFLSTTLHSFRCKIL